MIFEGEFCKKLFTAPKVISVGTGGYVFDIIEEEYGLLYKG